MLALLVERPGPNMQLHQLLRALSRCRADCAIFFSITFVLSFILRGFMLYDALVSIVSVVPMK